MMDCAHCPPGHKLSMDQQHTSWHDRRVHLSTRLRTLFSEWEVPPFGPEVPGSLVKLNQRTLLSKEAVSKQDVKHFFSTSPVWVNLRSINGLKYTFGNSFSSRSTQGQFVYHKISRTPGPKEEENYFALECREDGGLGISTHQVEALCPACVVFVNGTALIGSNRKLAFGDILTLCIVHDDRGGSGLGKVKASGDFIFKHATPCQGGRTVVVEGKEAEVGGGWKDIPLMVRNILLFLSTAEIKELRSVSSHWNLEALKVLRQRTTVTVLQPWKTDDWREWDEPEELMRIFDYETSILNDLDFPHWKMFLPECRSPLWSEEKKEEMNTKLSKVFEDLTWLLNPQLQTHNVKSLHLGGMLMTTGSVSEVGYVLCAVQNTLEELTLHFEVDPGSRILLKLPPRMPKLRVLAVLLHWENKYAGPNLRLSFSNHDGDEVEGSLTSFEGPVPELDYTMRFPSLSSLTLWPVEKVEPLDALPPIPPNRGSDRVGWTSFLPTLTAFLGRSTAVASLSVLVIPFLLRQRYHNILDNLETLFPNVAFPHEVLEQARQSPVFDAWEEREEIESQRAEFDEWAFVGQYSRDE